MPSFLGILKNNDLALRVRSLFLSRPRSEGIIQYIESSTPDPWRPSSILNVVEKNELPPPLFISTSFVLREMNPSSLFPVVAVLVLVTCCVQVESGKPACNEEDPDIKSDTAKAMKRCNSNIKNYYDQAPEIETNEEKRERYCHGMKVTWNSFHTIILI